MPPCWMWKHQAGSDESDWLKESLLRFAVDWVSSVKLCGILSVVSSCCLRGPVRLPVLMHCSITKIPVCRVRERRRTAAHRTSDCIKHCRKMLQRPRARVTWLSVKASFSRETKYETKGAVTMFCSASIYCFSPLFNLYMNRSSSKNGMFD